MFIGPMATLGSVPRLAAIRGDVEAVLAGLMLLLPLVVHDLYVEKRVHKVTLYGGIGFVVIILAPQGRPALRIGDDRGADVSMRNLGK